jgi:hypothetical protein
MTTRRTTRRRRITVTLVKDLVLFGAGLSLIIRQGWIVPEPEFNLSVLIFGGVLANVPGVSQLWALRTGGSLSGPPAGPSSPPPPSPASDSGAEP